MMTLRRLASLPLLLGVLFGSVPQAQAQQSYPTKFSSQLTDSDPVRQALDWLESNFDDQVEGRRVDNLSLVILYLRAVCWIAGSPRRGTQ